MGFCFDKPVESWKWLERRRGKRDPWITSLETVCSEKLIQGFLFAFPLGNSSFIADWGELKRGQVVLMLRNLVSEPVDVIFTISSDLQTGCICKKLNGEDLDSIEYERIDCGFPDFLTSVRSDPRSYFLYPMQLQAPPLQEPRNLIKIRAALIASCDASNAFLSRRNNCIAINSDDFPWTASLNI